MTAVLDGTHYRHFGIHEVTCCLYGDKPEDIIEVELEIAEDQTNPPADDNRNPVPDYWGWKDADNNEFSHMIYPKHFLLDMCFPGGISGAERVGQGKAYRLIVTPVKK